MFSNSPLMSALLSGRQVYQNNQVQPTKGSVEKVEYKAFKVLPWSKSRAAIHATRNMLSAPVYGSTKPNEFISIYGQPPQAPVILHVPGTAGSNVPQGGTQL